MKTVVPKDIPDFELPFSAIASGIVFRTCKTTWVLVLGEFDLKMVAEGEYLVSMGGISERQYPLFLYGERVVEFAGSGTALTKVDLSSMREE